MHAVGRRLALGSIRCKCREASVFKQFFHQQTANLPAPPYTLACAGVYYELHSWDWVD